MAQKIITALVLGAIIAGIGIFILKDAQVGILCGIMMAFFVFLPKKNR